MEKFNKDLLYKYIQNRYDVAMLPKNFFMKMAKIYKGTLQGLTKPILPEHLYDMWQQKANFLDKVYMRNIAKGKNMEGYLRLNYDLAILLSKYDDYLKWLDRQKASSVEKECIKNDISTQDTQHLLNNEKNIVQAKNDIADMLDDLI